MVKTLQVEINFTDQAIADLYQAVALLRGVRLGDVIADILDRYANVYADGNELGDVWARRYEVLETQRRQGVAIPQ